jgi:purine-nucleoside phosphorylase
MEEHLIEDLEEALPVLRSFLNGVRPVCGIVLGSGLNPYADRLQDAVCLPYGLVPHMQVSTALGHKGRFVLGTVPGTGQSVLCMQGRLHEYEGNTPQEVAFPIWLMHQAGIEVLITTNAAGAINPGYHVGDFCVMTDHINFTGCNPLVGRQPDRIAGRFVPMMGAYDADLVASAHSIANREGIALRFGTYLGLLGPSFETPAEIRMFATMGADTVAMSVIDEVIVARHCDMRVFGMSLVSNMACGVGDGDPQPDDIMQVAHNCQTDFAKVIDGLVATLGD